MKINIKATNLELTSSLKTYVEEKIGTVSKLIQKWDMDGGVEAYIEVGRTTNHHHKGDVFRAEVDLRLPNKVLRAEDENTDLYTAIDKVENILKREIDKYKGSNSVK
ncbi:MAG: ribosome-associated translation inhibitor RaiA [Candidatus Pacebacteria bacterium]|nr:ribosome-associated translation inhibitor RaiA [Candidatus Paceibacterota bacterium]